MFVFYQVFAMGVMPFLIRLVRLVVAYNQVYRFKYARFVKWTPLKRLWIAINTGLAIRGVFYYGSKPEHHSRYSGEHSSSYTSNRKQQTKGWVMRLQFSRREGRWRVGWFSLHAIEFSVRSLFLWKSLPASAPGLMLSSTLDDERTKVVFLSQEACVLRFPLGMVLIVLCPVVRHVDIPHAVRDEAFFRFVECNLHVRERPRVG